MEEHEQVIDQNCRPTEREQLKLTELCTVCYTVERRNDFIWASTKEKKKKESRKEGVERQCGPVVTRYF